MLIRVMILVNQLLAPVWYAVSQIAPKNEFKACFGAWFGARYSDNPKYLFEAAHTSGDVEAIWIGKSHEILRRLRSQGFSAYHAYSWRGLYHQVTSKFFFCCVNSRDFAPFTISARTTFVQLWHGMPIKKIGFDTDMSTWSRLRNHARRLSIDRYAYTISPSAFFDKSLCSAFLLPQSSILRCPLPRCDGLAADEHSRKERRGLLGISDDEIFVVYLPTHRDEGQSCDAILSALDDLLSIEPLLEELNMTVIVKPHFYDAHFSSAWPQSRRLRVVSDELDVYELLSVSEVLITDYSSVAFDYAVLRNPIIAHCPDLDEYRHKCRDLYHDVSEIFGHISLDSHGLSGLLRNAAEASHSGVRSNWLRSGLCFGDGAVGSLSQRAWQIIWEAVRVDTR
jgi:CDP-glycerol glycerophosphotransferase (TagB/SpsB family)